MLPEKVFVENARQFQAADRSFVAKDPCIIGTHRASATYSSIAEKYRFSAYGKLAVVLASKKLALVFVVLTENGIRTTSKTFLNRELEKMYPII